MKSRYQKYSNLINEVSSYTDWFKVRHALGQEYTAGRFYSLPFDIWSSQEAEIVEKTKLQELFENCMDKKVQLLPTGLYNMWNKEENSRFYRIVEKKLNAGIFLEFEAFLTMNNFPVEDAEKLINLFEKSLQFESNKSIQISDIEIFKGEYGIPSLYEKNDARRKALYDDFVQVDATYWAKELGVEISKRYRDRRDVDSIYSIYVSRLFDMYRKEFASIDRDIGRTIIFGFNNDIILSQFYTYDSTDSINVETSDRAHINKDNQKVFLINMIEALSKIGVLNELFQEENKNIEFINSLFNKSIKPYDTKERLLKRITSLDTGKVEDAVTLDVYMMHFLTKYAEEYETLSQIYLASCIGGNNNVIAHRKFQKEHSKIKLKDIAERYLSNPDNSEDYLRLEQMLKNITGIKDAKKFISENKDKENFDELLDSLVDIYYASRKSKIEGSESLEEFVGGIYKKFESFINEYNELINNNRNNESYVPSFEEYFDDVLKIYKKEVNKSSYEFDLPNMKYWTKMGPLIPSDRKQNQAILFGKEELDTYINKLGREHKEKGKGFPFVDKSSGSDLTRRIIEELWSIENDGIVPDPLPTIKQLCSDIIYKDKIYELRDFFLESIIEVYRQRPDAVSLRNNFESNGMYENIDIALPGEIQFFRCGYKSKNLSDKYKILLSSVPKIKPEAGKLFDLKESNIIRSFIPGEKNTTEQTQRFNELYNYLLTGKNTAGNINEEVIKERVNPIIASILELKTSLAGGFEKYRSEYTLDEENVDLSAEEKAFADVTLEILDETQMSPEDFFVKYFKITNKNVLEYCLRQIRERTIEQESKVETERPKGVIDAIITDGFSDGLLNQSTIQERTIIQNALNNKKQDKASEKNV